jgi:hypothetical protein
MKMNFLLLASSILVVSCYNAFSQNIGIGTPTPSRAKLEVHGSVGSTSAIFGGESTGISLQRNWPSIGFNQYYNGVSKYIGNGFAAVQFIDPNLGYMAFDMFPSGLANATAGAPIRAMHIHANGNVGIRGAAFPNASLAVAKIPGSDGTAVFQGTTYQSIFNSSVTEHTYIRGGKNNAEVFINDIPGGNIIVGAGTNRVGINVPFPINTLHLKGTLAVQPIEVIVSPTNPVVDVGTSSYISVKHSGEGPIVLGLTLTNGLAPGQIVILVAEIFDTSQRFVFGEGPNTDFPGTAGTGLRDNDVLVLVWNGTKWTQVCRSDNF